MRTTDDWIAMLERQGFEWTDAKEWAMRWTIREIKKDALAEVVTLVAAADRAVDDEGSGA